MFRGARDLRERSFTPIYSNRVLRGDLRCGGVLPRAAGRKNVDSDDGGEGSQEEELSLCVAEGRQLAGSALASAAFSSFHQFPI